MRKVMSASAALGIALLVTGCAKSEDKAQPGAENADEAPAAEPEKAQPPAEEPRAEESPSASMINDAKNCPSAAPDTTTAIAADNGKLVITIDGKVDGAVTLVRERAKMLSAIDPSRVSKPEHTGKGTGGGALGLCPILMPGTSIQVDETSTGVKVTLTPSDPAALGQLEQEADRRLTELMRMFRQKKAPGSLGHGSGGGGGEGGGHGEGGGEGEGQHKAADEPAAAAVAAGDDKPEKKSKAKKKKAKKKKKKAEADDDQGGW